MDSPLNTADLTDKQSLLPVSLSSQTNLEDSPTVVSTTADGNSISFTITVSDPEKHGENVKAYVTYKVTTKTTHPDFPPEEVYVRRRFNDFQWLRNQLTAAHPELLVPPLPERTPTSFLQRFDEFFLDKRRRALELFLHRVASHPKLSVSNDFLTFLHAKEWALKTAQESEEKGITNILSKLNFTWTSSSPETDPDFEKMLNLKNYLEHFQQQLVAINNLLNKAHEAGKEYATGMQDLGPAFLLLAQLENELCEGLTRTGATITDDAGKGFLHQVEYEEQFVAEVFVEYQLMAIAATDVLNNRDKQVAKATQAQQQLLNLKGELEKAKVQAAIPEENKSTFMRFKERMTTDTQSRIKTLEERVVEAETQMEERRAELKKTTSILIDEMEKFHVWKLRDFKTMLVDFINFQIEYHKKAQASWEALLPVVQGINKPSKRSTWWVSSK